VRGGKFRFAGPQGTRGSVGEDPRKREKLSWKMEEGRREGGESLEEKETFTSNRKIMPSEFKKVGGKGEAFRKEKNA